MSMKNPLTPAGIEPATFLFVTLYEDQYKFLTVSPWKWCRLTLVLLTWRIWWASNNANKWQMGFNSAFEGLRGEKLVLWKNLVQPDRPQTTIRLKRVWRGVPNKHSEYVTSIAFPLQQRLRERSSMLCYSALPILLNMIILYFERA